MPSSHLIVKRHKIQNPSNSTQTKSKLIFFCKNVTKARVSERELQLWEKNAKKSALIHWNIFLSRAPPSVSLHLLYCVSHLFIEPIDIIKWFTVSLKFIPQFSLCMHCATAKLFSHRNNTATIWRWRNLSALTFYKINLLHTLQSVLQKGKNENR